MIYYLVLIVTFLSIAIFLQNRQYRSIRFMLNRTNKINDRMICISEELSDFKDINDLYRKLLDETISLIEGADCGSILIYDKSLEKMDYKACAGYDEEVLRNIHLKKEELFLYDLNKLSAPAIIFDPLGYDEKKLDKRNFDELMDSKSLLIRSTLSAPLYINGEFYGLINIDNKSRVDAFNKNDIKIISYISKQLEIAIKNAALMNALNEAMRTDKLTDLYNRRYFEEIMDNILNDKVDGSKAFSAVMIDLDNFKFINDTYGHKAGDEVLKYFAEVLKKNVRNKDFVVRYAGDEFIIFLHNINREEAGQIIERIRDQLNKESSEHIKIEFSAGICEYMNNMDLDNILQAADNNMYQEKKFKKGNA